MTDLANDLPFIYVSRPPGDQLTDNNVVLIDAGANFHARRFITGNSVDGAQGWSKIQVYDRLRRSQTGLLKTGTPGESLQVAEWVLAPEVVYRGGDSIQYDADTTSKTTPIICFQGVRRFQQRVNPLPYRKGAYMERPYQYVQSVSVDAPVNFVAGQFTDNLVTEIRDYDFELRRILIVNSEDAGTPVANSNGGLFSYIIQNSNGQQMMNTYVPDWALGFNTPKVNNVFPIPGIIYQVGSLIRLQVTNMFVTGELGNGVRTQNIIFDGVQRFPCA